MKQQCSQCRGWLPCQDLVPHPQTGDLWCARCTECLLAAHSNVTVTLPANMPATHPHTWTSGVPPSPGVKP